MENGKETLERSISKYEAFELTLKGNAVLDAMRTGLIQCNEEGFAAFDRFWERFSPKIENRLNEIENRNPVFHDAPKHKTQRTGNNRRCYRNLVLTSISSFGVFYILGALLTSYGLGMFLTTLALCALTAFLTLKIKDAFS